jgi:hypothetical protein
VLPPVAQARRETRSAPTVERRFPVGVFFVGVVARGADETICGGLGAPGGNQVRLCHINGSDSAMPGVKFP